MPLSKRDREFRLPKISYLEFKHTEMDRVLTALFARLAHNGFPSRLRRKTELSVETFVEEEGTNEAMQEFVNPLADLGAKVTKLTTEIGMKAFQNPDEVGAAAVDYLRVCGHLVFAYLWAKLAKVALEKESSGDTFYVASQASKMK